MVQTYKKGQRAFFMAALVGLLILVFLMIKPFINVLLTSMVLAYVFHPFFNWLNKKVGNRIVSSLMIVLIVFLMISVPLLFLANSLYSEVRDSISDARSTINDDNSVNSLDNLFDYIQEKVPSLDVREKTNEVLLSFSESISKLSYRLVLNISNGVVDLFIMMFMLFFFLKDGKAFTDYIKNLFHLKAKHQKHIAESIERSVYAIIYGVIIVAFIQGALAGFGYWIVSLYGVLDNPILLALLTTFSAIIPALGTGLVWGPVSLFLIIYKGLILKDIVALVCGICLLAYGALFVSTIDNVLRAKIIGDKGNIHPLIVFIGVLGGLKLFGLIGTIVGPVVFAIVLKVIKLHKEERLF